jgi:Tat protein translocase TatB subunit
MFDVGFSEIFVIALVALIVIGPERLPKVARTLGHLFGRMQRYVNDVKADITREMELDELRKLQSTVEEANQAAAERGYPTPVDNDYFVVNDNPKLRTVPLSPDAEILLVDWNWCCEDFVTVDPQGFQASFGHPEYSSLHPQGEYSQYWVRVAGGIVVKIEEQYRP